MLLITFFFFQAEDGIRDKLVTGVQTCALPICFSSGEVRHIHWKSWGGRSARGRGLTWIYKPNGGYYSKPGRIKIGRASGRGRGEILGVAGLFKKNII